VTGRIWQSSELLGSELSVKKAEKAAAKAAGRTKPRLVRNPRLKKAKSRSRFQACRANRFLIPSVSLGIFFIYLNKGPLLDKEGWCGSAAGGRSPLSTWHLDSA
jgi:hypothetical protein